jgi:DNA excision repair protein ERCC-2
MAPSVKTYYGDLARLPDNHRLLHWAQLKVYGEMLCQARDLPTLNLRLTYYEIARRDETDITECFCVAAFCITAITAFA